MTHRPWHFHARSRLAISALTALAVALFAPFMGSSTIRAVVAYDAAACVYLALAWHMILNCTAGQTRERAAMDDPGRAAVFLIVLASGVAIVISALVVLRAGTTLAITATETLLGLTVSAAFLSWALTHTAFALHYAHLYYGGAARNGDTSSTSEGLLFPGSGDPSDLDFAYVAFTVGMTFQVSDVQVTSDGFRRAILGQSVLAFVYNTVIVALVLNLVFTWLQMGRS